MVLCGRAGPPVDASALSVDGSDAENRLYIDWLFFCLRLTRKINNRTRISACEMNERPKGRPGTDSVAVGSCSEMEEAD